MTWNERFSLKLDKLSDDVLKFADVYQDVLEKATKPINKVLDYIGLKVWTGLLDFSKTLMEFYGYARALTIPLHWLWIWGWIYFYNNRDEREPTNTIGTHYVQALAGGGKSTFIWQKIHDYAKMTGKCSYITTEMEKLKFDTDGTPYVHHIHFRPKDFYGVLKEGDQFGEQKKRFNSDLACCLAFDEIHVLNNNRLNGSRAYNHVFIPMINSFVLQRHFGINWVIVASQQPKNDNQIMNILVGYHRVAIKKGFIYSKWLNDGKFERKIKGWSVRSYTVKVENNYLKLASKKRWFKRATVSFDDFESLNMAKTLNHLPVDRKAVV